MWRYVSGEEPPAKKRKQTSEERLEKGKNYEKEKRSRTFRQEWTKGREWLQFENEAMTCNWCCEFSKSVAEKKNTFVVGCKNLKLDAINIHEKSEMHRRSAERKAAQTDNIEKSSAGKAISAMNCNVFGRLSALFRNVHAVAKNRRPFTDYVWMCSLDEQKGVDIGQTYRNDKQAATFAECIAEAAKCEMLSFHNQSKFVSVIVDGCTDSSRKEEEIVYIRSSQDGEVRTSFLNIGNPDRANADGILTVIKHSLEPVKTWEKRIVGLGSDGASVMTGKTGGVVAKLKTIQPCIVGVHCFAHRLELSYKDAMKSISTFSRMNTLLTGLYKFYFYSPLNRKNLEESFESLSEKPLMPKRCGGTRWLGHTEKALENFWAGYAAITQHLEQLPCQKGASADVLGKGKGFLQMLRDRQLITFMLFMTDVVSCLAKLSVMLQESSATICDMKEKLDMTVSVLQKYSTKDGSWLRRKDEVESVLGKEMDVEAFRSLRESVVSAVEACLQKRFSDIDEGVMAASAVASFRRWPERLENEEDFGDEAISTLTNHFGPVLREAGVDVNKVQLEWELLKTAVYQRSKDVTQLSWESISRQHRDFPNMLGLVDLLLTLPVHSADAERGFSEMKLVKTDWRASLSPEMLSNLLCVLFHTPDIEKFDPAPAINIWMSTSTQRRRPTVQPYGPRAIDESESDSDSC